MSNGLAIRMDPDTFMESVQELNLTRDTTIAIDIAYWDPAPVITLNFLGHGVATYMLDFPAYYMSWEISQDSSVCSLRCACGTPFNDSGEDLHCWPCGKTRVSQFYHEPRYVKTNRPNPFSPARTEPSLATYCHDLILHATDEASLFDRVLGAAIIADLLTTFNDELVRRL